MINKSVGYFILQTGLTSLNNFLTKGYRRLVVEEALAISDVQQKELLGTLPAGNFDYDQLSKESRKQEKLDLTEFAVENEDPFDSTVENEDPFESTVENNDTFESTVENNDPLEFLVENKEDNDSDSDDDIEFSFRHQLTMRRRQLSEISEDSIEEGELCAEFNPL